MGRLYGCLVSKRAGMSRGLDWPFMRNNFIGEALQLENEMF